ncbi:MAG TPA: DUF2281 domain-containing protein [Chloroflexota bacterium]|nr:DUF2281 domain-containing protein [Chloroflexota bacterium]
MEPVSIERIEAQLRKLPPEKLEVVSDFVSYLAERLENISPKETMLAAEPVLAQDWTRPEEDAAWADL